VIEGAGDTPNKQHAVRRSVTILLMRASFVKRASHYCDALFHDIRPWWRWFDYGAEFILSEVEGLPLTMTPADDYIMS
jgi:hypothetical protein